MTVSARFAVFDNNQEVDLQDLYMNVLRMKYAGSKDSVTPDSGVCWNRPGGTLANLSDWLSKPLPDTSVRLEPWSHAEIVLRTPDGPVPQANLADFSTGSDPRHAKFYLVRNADTLRALFEVPAGMEIHLLFSQDIVQMWSWGNETWVPFNFDAGQWAGSLDPKGAWTKRQDGMHHPYVLFSPTENAATWSDLKARFPTSFVADTIQVR